MLSKNRRLVQSPLVGDATYTYGINRDGYLFRWVTRSFMLEVENVDEFKNELKKLKVDKFKGGEVKPWDQGNDKDAMMVRGRCGGGCGRCGGCGGCGRCHSCSCSCSCSCSWSCSCSCFCSCFFPCFFNCFR